jgi:DNA polymerase III alpha subunit
MPIANYPTAHCHIQSFDSASTPEAFAERELELGTGTLCTTDHGTMGASRKVYDIAKKKGLTPILGLEAYFRDDSCPILRAEGVEDIRAYEKYYHITMHCLDAEAFSFLSQKLSRAPLERHGSQQKPLFNWRDLEEIGAHNITLMSGCLVGMVQRHILRDGLDLPVRFKIADAYYQRLRALSRQGNFYAEIFPHRCDKNWVQGYFLDFDDGNRVRYWEKKKLRMEHLGEVTAAELARKFGTQAWKEGDRLVAVMNNRKWEDREPVVVCKAEHVEDFFANECQPWCPDGDVQLGCNRVVVQLARRYGDKIIISDDSHFASEDEKVVQDIRLAQQGSWRFYGNYHRQSGEESFKYFNQYMGINAPRFGEWVNNNREWAERFKGFVFDSTPSLPTKFYPDDSLKHTHDLIAKHGRMDWNNRVYVDRLNAEIELLHRNGRIDLLPYLFIDEEVCYLHQQNGLLTGPGRGSAAGLLLAYLMGITHVDPIKYGLSLERFLTLDRIKSGKLPDVDQDLPHRDLLVGHEVAGFEVTLADGSKKHVRRDQRVETDLGTMTVEEAFQKKADVKAWL